MLGTGLDRGQASMEREIMSASVPKNDREWWASREIARLREELSHAVREREDAIGLSHRQALYIQKLEAVRDAARAVNDNLAMVKLADALHAEWKWRQGVAS